MHLIRCAWRQVALAAMAVLALTSCQSSASKSSLLGTFRMGERVQAGPLVYNVLESQWKAQLSDGGRAPQNRFVVIKLSITNSGGQPVSLPTYELLAKNGQTFTEVTEGVAEVPDWLGMLRSVPPAGTVQGNIVFDAPMAAYKLVVTDGGEVGSEKQAHIEIPVQLE